MGVVANPVPEHNFDGKIFIAEQPSGCGSWNLACLQDMQKRNYSTHLDMCQFGLKDPYNKLPYRHRTKLCHNSSFVHDADSKPIC